MNLEALSVTLSQWERRDDTRPQPEIRRAANTAMDEIDAMLRELHTLRGQLVSEIRDSDDVSGWQATVEGPGVTERSPMPFRTRKRAQAWADNRAGGAS